MGTTARAGAFASVLAAIVVLFGGPSWFVIGLPLALAGVLLGLQSMALERTGMAVAACVVGVLALLIPLAQFGLQS